jgi:hypothetical protein
MQDLLAARTSPAAHGTVPVPVAENSPLDAIVLIVIELVLTFFTVTDFAALVVPTA